MEHLHAAPAWQKGNFGLLASLAWLAAGGGCDGLSGYGQQESAALEASAASLAAEMLGQGFTEVGVLEGGVLAWRSAGLP